MTITVPTFVLVLPLILAVFVVVGVLGWLFMDWLEPKFLRWYWHHIGGEGEPPEEWNDR